MKKLFNIKRFKRGEVVYLVILLIFFLFLIIFRFHNALAFNPYWGYDGGGHIDYLFSIAYENKIPEVSQNYIAWHEPLYYFVFGGLLKLALLFKSNLDFGLALKVLSSLQVILSLLTTLVIFKLTKLLTKNRVIIVLATILINLLPSFNQASTFLTNELLNYFFIFLILYYFFKNFVFKKKPLYKNYFILGLLLGLALLTKITALILLIIISLYLLWRLIISRKRIKTSQGLALIILLVFIINLPLQIYRQQNDLDLISVNNTNFLEPQSLKLDERVKFFAFLDKDIFLYPYWYSGGRSFWSMLYADTFYDYYGSIENQNYINYLLGNDPSQLEKTTHANTYVTKNNFIISKILVWLALLLLVIFIWGLVGNIKKFINQRKSVYFLYSFIPLSFLASLIYFAYRYPYYDHGIVKAIFIFPAFIFLIIPGLEAIYKLSKKTIYVLVPLVLIYSLLIIQLYWVVKFNY